MDTGIKVFILKNGKTIVGKWNTETDIIENVMEFYIIPIMAPDGGLVLSTVMMVLGAPINRNLISVPYENLGIICEITEFDEKIPEEYERKINIIQHPEVVQPKSKLIKM